MTELPDVSVYVERLAARTVGQELHTVRLKSPFLLRTFFPPLSSTFGKRVLGLRRLGKRIVFELEGDLFLVIHLMIAGRFRWYPGGKPAPKRMGLATLEFSTGTLVLTEAGSKRRASLHLVEGAAALEEMNRGGL